jgi:hypothetical protein
MMSKKEDMKAKLEEEARAERLAQQFAPATFHLDDMPEEKSDFPPDTLVLTEEARDALISAPWK